MTDGVTYDQIIARYEDLGADDESIREILRDLDVTSPEGQEQITMLVN